MSEERRGETNERRPSSFVATRSEKLREPSGIRPVTASEELQLRTAGHMLRDMHSGTPPEFFQRLEEQCGNAPSDREQIRADAQVWERIPRSLFREGTISKRERVHFGWPDGRVELDALAADGVIGVDVSAQQGTAYTRRGIGGHIYETRVGGGTPGQLDVVDKRSSASIAGVYAQQHEPPTWIGIHSTTELLDLDPDERGRYREEFKCYEVLEAPPPPSKGGQPARRGLVSRFLKWADLRIEVVRGR